MLHFKNFPNLLISALLLFAITNSSFAQSKRTKKPQIDFWKEKVWFGGGFNLGFNSSIYNGLQSNVFGIGVSPMAAYKFNKWLSAGPRVSIDFTTAKFSDGFDTYRYNSVDYGMGLFGRIKFSENFFLHGEYSFLNETYTTGEVNNDKLVTQREWRDILLLGLGYSSGGEVAYEIYINYDFLEDPESFRVPIIYRAGITFKF
ncbi:MAG: hypothetical protein IPM34_09915 [Saprospiraceae bacterium]|nr:hypothetical protein [Saprospiraceae bacterium]